LENFCVSEASDERELNLVVLNRNAFAPLVSSAFEYESTAPRFHARSKAMRFRPAAIIGLKRSLWHFYAPRKTLNVAHQFDKNQRHSLIENTKWKCYASAAPRQKNAVFSTLVEIFVDISPLKTK
jgi:hypothetical protein